MQVEKETPSVDRVSQKSVKLDPDAYGKLTLIRGLLRKYLRKNVSYSETIRWLSHACTGEMNQLSEGSQRLSTEESYAVGTYGEPEYLVKLKKEKT